MSNDAIVLLKEDHRRLRVLLRRIEDRKHRAGPELTSVVRELCTEFELHVRIKDELVAPTVATRQTNEEEGVLRTRPDDEHRRADQLLRQLTARPVLGAEDVPEVLQLKELILEHIEQEEATLFPLVREVLGRNGLRELGGKMLERRDRLEQQLPVDACEPE